MAGTSHAPAPAWTAVVLMIIGFTICTVAFIWHNNIPLWILGGVVGGVGVILGRIYHLLDSKQDMRSPNDERLDPASH